MLLLQSPGAGHSYSGTITIEEGTLGMTGSLFSTTSSGSLVLKDGARVANGSTAAATVTQLQGTNVTHMEGKISLVGTTGGTSGATRLVFGIDRNVARAVNLTGDVELYAENPLNDAGGGYITISGISESGGSYSVTKTGPGLIEMGRNASTYTGGTFIKEGTLRLGGGGDANRLPSTGAVEVDGGTFAIEGSIGNQTIGTLTLKSGSVVGDTFVRLDASSYQVESGTISKWIGGTGSTFTKSTSGTVVLSGQAVYTGVTTVNEGTLHVTNSGSIGDSSAITINAGGHLIYSSSTAREGSITLNGNGILSRAVLGGNGTINAAVALNDLGDTLSPGESPGILGFGTSQSWDSFAYDWEINDFPGTTPGGQFDVIEIEGSLDLTGDFAAYVLNIISLNGDNEPGNVPNFSEIDNGWIILSTTDGITGFDVGSWTLNTSGFSSESGWTGFWDLSVVGNDLVLSYLHPIPKASTWYLMALVAGIATVYLRRQRRS